MSAAINIEAVKLHEFHGVHSVEFGLWQNSQAIRLCRIAALRRAAFAALEEFVRDFKRRYFIKPPLTDADFISLGLRPPGSTRARYAAGERA
jgi:hypothetical protein